MAKAMSHPISDACIALIKTYEEKYQGSTSSCEFIDLSEVTLIHLSGIHKLSCCAVTMCLVWSPDGVLTSQNEKWQSQSSSPRLQ